jgi:hypothetical protein
MSSRSPLQDIFPPLPDSLRGATRLKELEEIVADADRTAAEKDVSTPVTPATLAKTTGELLDECAAWISRYILLTSDQAVILSAWLLHTHASEASESTPYIHITAPEKECGKSRLMETLEAVASAPIRSGGMTAAALVRTIETKNPTLFLDEMDAQLGGDKEYAEIVRGILNEGFRRGGVFHKCVGKDFTLRTFNVYCPKCFAGIGQLPDTVASRSIVIEMRRKLMGEIVEPFRQKAVKLAAAPIKAALEQWGTTAIPILEEMEPAPIDGIGDRQNDITEPLLCIAQLAGKAYLGKLRSALRMAFHRAGAEDASNGAALLTDLRLIFDERSADAVPSKILAESLREIEGRPWAEWSRGKGMTANNLARLLKSFQIFPQTIRIGSETAKGYRRRDLEDAWSRYCPLPSIRTVTTSQCASSLVSTAFSDSNPENDVTVAKNASHPHEHLGVTDVTSENPKEALLRSTRGRLRI